MWILMIVLITALFLYYVKLYNMGTCTLAIFYDSMTTCNMRKQVIKNLPLLFKEGCNFDFTAQNS